jgi:hypothetical protein
VVEPSSSATGRWCREPGVELERDADELVGDVGDWTVVLHGLLSAIGHP